MIRTNKTRGEILRLQSSPNIRHKGDSQKHMISLLKFEGLPPLIMTALLSTLRCLNIFLDHLHFLYSLLNNLWSQNNTLPIFIPTKRIQIPLPIQCFERCHSNTRMIVVIICKLSKWQETVSSTSLF